MSDAVIGAWPRRDVVTIRAEQALYGSFPFRQRGYEIAAHSAGCRPEWLRALARSCTQFGERPTGVAVSGALFAKPIPGTRVWMVVVVGEAGRDDLGRPGALAFHAWFVTDRDYRRIGAQPFGFAALPPTGWDSDSGTLPTATLRLTRLRCPGAGCDPRARTIAERLRQRQPVAFEAPAPIGDLAREIWNLLPLRIRCRTSLATWAFSNANRFDLVAVPRRALIEADPAYLDAAALAERPPGWSARLARRALAALRSRV